ncbi:hypothetical protein [Ideonella sp. BN130291]|uniref:hypothetical protein n=1 Tax=Ideonella sp. BN130291 TaxID=3112940 RepID=UPI002E26C50D|nr:hypothetical protein [Ideonella sp. BN130291]
MAHIRQDVYKSIAENDIGDVVFQDPFTEETRKAKRNVVAAAFAALLVAALDLQVNGFLGLQTATGVTLGGEITKGLACVIVTYFLAAFLLSAFVDYAAWKFKRERILTKPYVELIAMLEAHFHVTGEQVNNATIRVEGVTVENDMRTQVEFQKILAEAKGQLSSIQQNMDSFYEEVEPLLSKWRGLINKAERLSWRLRARFLSLWVLDIFTPLTLASFALWRTSSGLPSVWIKIAT